MPNTRPVYISIRMIIIKRPDLALSIYLLTNANSSHHLRHQRSKRARDCGPSVLVHDCVERRQLSCWTNYHCGARRVCRVLPCCPGFMVQTVALVGSLLVWAHGTLAVAPRPLPAPCTDFYLPCNISYHNVATLGLVARETLKKTRADIDVLQSLTANEYFGMNLGGEFPGPSFVDRKYLPNLTSPVRLSLTVFQLRCQAWKLFEPTLLTT